MRDSQALEVQLRIERKVGAEVELQQLAVLLLEAVERQRLARLGQCVGDLLELGEHRLADDRAADVVDARG